MQSHDSYLNPHLTVRERGDAAGKGLFATKPIQAGELLIVWGGYIVNREQLEALPPEIRIHTVQVDEGLYQASFRPEEPSDYINHSCNPNAGLRGQISIVAMRDIQPGEEICFDYAMSDGTSYDEFDCACGAPGCRGRVTGDDWKNPVLWEQYAGFFSPYLQRRIDKLRDQPK